MSGFDHCGGRRFADGIYQCHGEDTLGQEFVVENGVNRMIAEHQGQDVSVEVRSGAGGRRRVPPMDSDWRSLASR